MEDMASNETGRPGEQLKGSALDREECFSVATYNNATRAGLSGLAF